MLYFAYGSNLNLNQMYQRCGGSIGITQAILHDYKLVYRRGVATVEPSVGDKVYGALYLISDTDLDALDVYEGTPTFYYREDVVIETKSSGLQTAMTYIMHQHYMKLPPSEFYYGTIEEGYKDWELPVEHLAGTLLQEEGV